MTTFASLPDCYNAIVGATLGQGVGVAIRGANVNASDKSPEKITRCPMPLRCWLRARMGSWSVPGWRLHWVVGSAVVALQTQIQRYAT